MTARPVSCCVRLHSRLARARRTFASKAKQAAAAEEPDHNYNTHSGFNALLHEDDRAATVFNDYALVTARSLAQHERQPRCIKMLARDFIDDSLYHPRYGYFSKQAVILSGPRETDFSAFRDNDAFQESLSQAYAAFETTPLEQPLTAPRQVWQTPTEMFRPYYGQAIARYLLTQYKLTHYPYHDLVLYELGAGNGTLMLDVLDYIRDTEPEIYERTRYRVIEISGQLAKKQAGNLFRTADEQGHGSKVGIINKSIFAWDTVEPSPCFFLAMEVFDNFAHDAVRYDLVTGQPYQALVAIDDVGDYHEILSPILDPLVSRYFVKRAQALKLAQLPSDLHLHPALKVPSIVRRLRAQLPFAANLTTPEFVPTKLLEFIEILHLKFPQHRLVASDFHALPDAMEGINAPVVQTRYKGTMVPCSTYMVHPGYFDIMFPTRFNLLNRMYSEAGNARSGYFSHVRHRTGLKGRVSTHAEFLRNWGDVQGTTTRSGENPMLEFYENASFIVT